VNGGGASWARAGGAPPGLRDAVVPPLHLWRGLLRAAGQELLPQRYRAFVLLARVRLWALLWAVGVPLWIPFDLLLIGGPLGRRLALGRLAVAALLAAGAWLCRCAPRVHAVRKALAVLFGAPLLYFMVVVPAAVHASGLPAAGAALREGYRLMPLLIAASIGLLPVTLLEGLAVAGGCLLAAALGHYASGLPATGAEFGRLWVLLVAGLIGTLAGVSQTALLLQHFRDAATDPLTGLLNRRAGVNLLALQWEQAQRGRRALSVAMIDLDRFKRVNDTYGHEAGDRVLTAFAVRLRAALRAGDALLRWGGEEFVAILPGAGAEEAARRLEQVLREGAVTGPDGAALTFSAGVAERSREDAPGPEALVALADRRMYAAKAAGRAMVVGSDPGHPQAATR